MAKKGKCRIIALTTAFGTACPETVLYKDEDTPEARAKIEAQFCLGQYDSPLSGTWQDVTDNDAI